MTLALLTAALTLATMPQLDGALVDYVDVLEVNRIYDDRGREVLVQLLGWEKSSAPSGFSIVFWRLMRDEDRGMYPSFSYATQTYTSEFYDGETLRRVKAKKRWERWLQYDVEIRERDVLPKDQRRELTKLRESLPSEADLEINE